MILELNVARVQGLLPGDTAEERFQSFINHITQPAHGTALLQEYPVLGRLVVESLDRWVAVSVEFVQRLCADWLAIQQTFAPPEDPGPLVQVAGGMGDTHRGGRSVVIATFRSGFRLVYKPKSLAIDRHFQQLLAWLNARGAQPPLRTLMVLDRGPYGWVEYVNAESCASPEAVQRFYERQGSYLAYSTFWKPRTFTTKILLRLASIPAPLTWKRCFIPACVTAPLHRWTAPYIRPWGSPSYALGSCHNEYGPGNAQKALTSVGWEGSLGSTGPGRCCGWHRAGPIPCT